MSVAGRAGLTAKLCHRHYTATRQSLSSSCIQQQPIIRSNQRICHEAKQPRVVPNNAQQRSSPESFFHSTRYRYVSNEVEELRQRYIEFDVEELAREAARAAGKEKCVSIVKGDDGSFNRILVLEMEDGTQVVAKIPTPNAGPAELLVDSEVATMEFVRSKLGVPVPKVLAWNSGGSRNRVGAAYIMMEKAKGIPLSKAWTHMSLHQRTGLIQNFANIQRAWTSATFNSYGSLYFSKISCKKTPPTALCISMDGNEVYDARFVIGPTVGRGWFEDGRAQIQCDRGPWSTVKDYKDAAGRREITCVGDAPSLPQSWMLLCGQGTYIRRREKKIQALQCYLALLPYLLPLDPRLSAATIWHADTHAENIFVDPENPEEITGIIDWQSVEVAPLFEFARQPGFLDHHGPSIEGFERPKMPAELGRVDQEDRAGSRELWIDQTLEVYYKTLIRKRVPLLEKVRQFRETDAENLMLLARQLLVDGEAHYLYAVAMLQAEWTKLPIVQAMSDSPDFPIEFTERDLLDIENDATQSLKAMDAMNELKEALGSDLPDRGAVLPEEYDRIKSRLADLKAQFFNKYGSLEWPYDD